MSAPLSRGLVLARVCAYVHRAATGAAFGSSAPIPAQHSRWVSDPDPTMSYRPPPFPLFLPALPRPAPSLHRPRPAPAHRWAQFVLLCQYRRLTPLELQDEAQIADLIAKKRTSDPRFVCPTLLSCSLLLITHPVPLAGEPSRPVHQQDPSGAKALQFARAHRRLQELVRPVRCLAALSVFARGPYGTPFCIRGLQNNVSNRWASLYLLYALAGQRSATITMPSVSSATSTRYPPVFFPD